MNSTKLAAIPRAGSFTAEMLAYFKSNSLSVVTPKKLGEHFPKAAQPTIQHHLKKLQFADLIDRIGTGQYRLHPDHEQRERRLQVVRDQALRAGRERVFQGVGFTFGKDQNRATWSPAMKRHLHSILDRIQVYLSPYDMEALTEALGMETAGEGS
jgi:hypothetical protein